MILTGSEIQKQHNAGIIVIDPFISEFINPNSYDLRLGNQLLIYDEPELSPQKNNRFHIETISESGYILKKNCFYLGSSIERIGSTKFVPLIHAKSGIARLGLFVHITADLIDIGSIGTTTFQLYPTLDIRVFPGMRIGQVSFWTVKGDIRLYQGKYQGSEGPQPSKSYMSFEELTLG